MAWSFRKRIKIIPGVHLNFSSRGISTSIGVKGASVTIGKSGTYLNTSVPILGLRNRTKISVSEPQVHPTIPIMNDGYSESGNIFSADIYNITSQDMHGVREAILLARKQKAELQGNLQQITTALRTSKLKRSLSFIFLYGFIKKSIPENLQIDIDNQNEAKEQTLVQINSSYVQLDMDFEPEIQKKYKVMIETFVALSHSKFIWDVTSSHYQDRIVARSSASTLVDKKTVKFELRSLDYIKSDFQALYFQNANGADFYFYPGFIIMFSGQEKFAVIGYKEINLHHNFLRFIETGTVPGDAKVIDRTWAKVNKNGTPDKRFKGNYQIPIVKYGVLSLTTTTGVNEMYHFSNYEASAAFKLAFQDYKNIISDLNKMEMK